MLAQNPRPEGSEKLTGQERYRIRQGRYRIVYSIQDEAFTVWIVKVLIEKMCTDEANKALNLTRRKTPVRLALRSELLTNDPWWTKIQRSGIIRSTEGTWAYLRKGIFLI